MIEMSRPQDPDYACQGVPPGLCDSVMSGTAHARHFAPPSQAAEGPGNLIGLSREELEAAVLALGEPVFRAGQLWHWIYHRGAADFSAMTSLS